MTERELEISNRWMAVRANLLDAATRIEEASELAASQVGEVQAKADPERGSLDPRRSQLLAAKFASSLAYQASSVRSAAERIERKDTP